MRGGRRPPPEGRGGGRDRSPHHPPRSAAKSSKDPHFDCRPAAPRRHRSSVSPHRREGRQQRHHGRLPPHHHHDRSSVFDDRESYELRHEYPLQGLSVDSNPDAIPGGKSFRDVVWDDGYHHRRSGGRLRSSSLEPGRREIMDRQARYFDDRPPLAVTLLPRSPGRGYSSVLNSSSIGRTEAHPKFGLYDNDGLPNKDSLRGTYNEGDREKLYSRDLSYPTIPISQMRQYGSSSSSGLPKEDFVGPSRVHLDLLPTDGFSERAVSKFTDNPLDHRAHARMHLVESLQRPVSPLARDASRGYNYDGLRSQVKVAAEFVTSSDVDRKASWGLQGGHGESMSYDFVELVPDDADGPEASRRKTSASSFWEEHGNLPQNHHDMKGVHGDYVSGYGSTHMGLKMRLPRDHEHAPYEGSYEFGRDADRERLGSPILPNRERVTSPVLPDRERLRSPVLRGRQKLMSPMLRDRLRLRSPAMRGRERLRSPILPDRERLRSHVLPRGHTGAMRHSVSPPRHVSHMKDFDLYDQSPGRMIRRRYPLDSDIDRSDFRSSFWDVRGSLRHPRALSGEEEPWYENDDDGAELLPSRSLMFGHAQYGAHSGTISGSDTRLQAHDSLPPYPEDGRDMSLKRRLRPGPLDFHGSLHSKRRDESSRPYKLWKRGAKDQPGGRYAHDDNVPDEEMPFTKSDPPEDSEEFRKQVNKTFLRFIKFLYGNPFEQKRYREPERSSVLICCVCGSLSKEFSDTHSLVTHTYRSLKAGLRTNHLGLHKALCVLMGWNWLIPPDNPRVYQFSPPEAKSLREDLILWPPIVIIHNSSIGSKNNKDGPRIITNEGLVNILTGMGFEAGKIQICRGKPASRSVLLVKFMPTFSGLQEAERLHNYYADKSCGRKEFQQLSSCKNSNENVVAANAEKVNELLYGYLAIAEDLDKIEPGTKKRCLVKSKRDIVAIADAPLDTD